MELRSEIGRGQVLHGEATSLIEIALPWERILLGMFLVERPLRLEPQTLASN